MNDSPPTELILIWQGIKIVLRRPEVSEGVWTDVGKSAVGIGRPREGGHALDDFERTRCASPAYMRGVGNYCH
jgi:hypothetical protein